MPANVRSIPAIADFRAALATFGDAAGRALDEVRMEMQRGLAWVTDEQPTFWKAEHQRAFDLVAEKRKELEECQNRTYDNQRATCHQERKAMEAAKRYVRFVEDKIDAVRRWGRTLVQETSEYEGQVGKFRDLLEIELPRALALLDRIATSLEAYTSVASGQAVVPLGHEPQSIARTEPPSEAAPQPSVFQALREMTPKPEVLAAAEPVSPDQLEKLLIAVGRGAAQTHRDAGQDTSASRASGEHDLPDVPQDEDACQQAALKTAYDLRLEPVMPDWSDAVVLAAGCLANEQVYLERGETSAGQTGWFIGPITPRLGEPPVYQTMPLAALVRLRPALMLAIALPPGHLAVFSNDQLVAVVNAAGEDIWERHLRAMAEEQLKED